MPLLNDAKTCYVGTQPITKIYAGTELVWPKTLDYIYNNDFMWPKQASLPANDSDSYGGPVLPLLSGWDDDTGMCEECLDNYTVRIGIVYDKINGTYPAENDWGPWEPLSGYCDPPSATAQSGITISPDEKKIFWHVPNFADRGPSGSEDLYWYEVRYNGTLITSEWARVSSAQRITLPDDSKYNPCPEP